MNKQKEIQKTYDCLHDRHYRMNHSLVKVSFKNMNDKKVFIFYTFSMGQLAIPGKFSNIPKQSFGPLKYLKMNLKKTDFFYHVFNHTEV